MLKNVAKGLIWVVATFYAYGASVHVMNMLSLTGFNWLNAPVKWQLLDIVYLCLDLLVALGFLFGWRISYVAFYLAAVSQCALYTLFRAWIIDVPEEFAVSSEQVSYLNDLVVFHVVTLILVTIAVKVTHTSQSYPDVQPRR